MTLATSEEQTAPIPDPTPAAAPVDWRKTHAFGLPEGSIRALLAIGIFATIWVLLIRKPDQEVPDYLRDLLFIIMGHYFASRRQVSVATAAGPGPLFLPRGAVRIMLFLGFVGVAAILYQQGRMTRPRLDHGVVTLMLVAGFLLGVVVAKVGDWWTGRGHHVPRWVEDTRALVAIVAALCLIVMVWNRYDPFLIPRNPDLLKGADAMRFGSYGPEHVFGAIVGFYFGSRS